VRRRKKPPESIREVKTTTNTHTKSAWPNCSFLCLRSAQKLLPRCQLGILWWGCIWMSMWGQKEGRITMKEDHGKKRNKVKRGEEINQNNHIL
jgi:hypothetical protein